MDDDDGDNAAAAATTLAQHLSRCTRASLPSLAFVRLFRGHVACYPELAARPVTATIVADLFDKGHTFTAEQLNDALRLVERVLVQLTAAAPDPAVHDAAKERTWRTQVAQAVRDVRAARDVERRRRGRDVEERALAQRVGSLLGLGGKPT